MLCRIDLNFPPFFLVLAHAQTFFHGVSLIHRYRRPRLLTVIVSITHARDHYEHSKWRLNRAKYWERYSEKPCFLYFTSPHRLQSCSTTYFRKERTRMHVLIKYLYKLMVIKAKKSIAKCRLKSIS